jgi:hypothetical protein
MFDAKLFSSPMLCFSLKYSELVDYIRLHCTATQQRLPRENHTHSLTVIHSTIQTSLKLIPVQTQQ